eukprot:4441882-Prymnesium_polylepis.1
MPTSRGGGRTPSPNPPPHHRREQLHKRASAPAASHSSVRPRADPHPDCSIAAGPHGAQPPPPHLVQHRVTPGFPAQMRGGQRDAKEDALRGSRQWGRPGCR